MKKSLFLVGSMLFVLAGFGQNVGIGTLTPTDKLTVSTATANYGAVHTDGTITVGTWVGNGGGYIGTKSVHPLRFFTGNGTTQMTLLTNGNLGIGTTLPQSKLVIQTPNNMDGFTHLSEGGIVLKTAVGGVSAVIGTSSNHTFRLIANGVSVINMDPVGNVGIGITDQVFKLDVANRIRIRSGSESSTAGIWLNNPLNSATVAFVGIKSVDQVGLYGNNSLWGLTMNTNTGAVSIGSQNPVAGYRLSVFGNTYTNGTIYTTGDAEISGLANISGDVHVGGTVVAPGGMNTEGWSVNGVGSYFFISGHGTQLELHDGDWDVYSTSDRNLKKNIQALPPVLKNVMALNASQYYYKSDLKSEQLSTGFIAQDVQKLFPFAVHTKTDLKGEKSLSLAYRQFSVIAIKAIQEQQDIINYQQSKIDAMEKRLLALENRNSQ
ncbi:MAG: tail fiber domain-containing protein [Bacteroidota bacterium]